MPSNKQFDYGTVEHQMIQALVTGLQETSTQALSVPTTPDELYAATVAITGMHIPTESVCPNHQSPWEAYCAAYFAESPVVVWKASRGLGGKSVLLATLAMVEAVTLGAAVNLLGGSGEQSQRVLGYMTGDDTNLPNRFWAHKTAPVHLLATDTQKRTRLTNNGRINTLTASQKSVRGPHPQRLRLDECDEMDLEIFDAAMGQPLPARGIQDQTVCSSTHQYPDGTMTTILERAQKQGWPKFEWCYRESLTGWLTQHAVQRTKERVTEAMWQVEYELQEPSAEGRAIDPEAIQKMFRRELGVFEDIGNELIVAEPPEPGAEYVTGADWAKRRHWTNLITWRVDCEPMRVVAYRRINRVRWPAIVAMFEQQCLMYPGDAVHDATGIGTVIEDLIVDVHAQPVIMAGRPRYDMFSNYIKTVENGEIISPYIEPLYKDHVYCSIDDLYGRGHPPDGIAAMSLANIVVRSGWAIGAAA